MKAPSAHYENFPVASWLCPPHLRRPIAAIYWFARTADDIADEGHADAAVRMDDLRAYRDDLARIVRGHAHSERWSAVFEPLAVAVEEFALPRELLDDLLSAFMQDVAKTRDGEGYADRAELLDYCRRSANPIGRLLLHLYGVNDALSHSRSDQICSALQLINFWQDLSVDLPRGRSYLPLADVRAHGLDMPALNLRQDSPAARKLVAAEVRWARELMDRGAPLVRTVPGRAGWELRAVVQGGLRILERIEAIRFDTLRRRPTLAKTDAPLLLWRMLRM